MGGSDVCGCLLAELVQTINGNDVLISVYQENESIYLNTVKILINTNKTYIKYYKLVEKLR